MNRRDFLAGTTVGIPFQAAVAQQVPPPRYTGRPELKITDVQAFLVNAGRNYVYVKVSTDQGIHGWGEAYSAGPDEATVATVRDFKEWLVGKDPRNVEYLWATMYNFTRFPGGLVVNAAISGIEHALWDIAGKAAGLPVYMLMGGKCREQDALLPGRQLSRAGPTADRQIRLHGAQGHAGFHQYRAVEHHGPRLRAKGRSHAQGRRDRMSTCASTPTPESGAPYVAYELAEALKPVQSAVPRGGDPAREYGTPWRSCGGKVQIPIATGEELYTKFQFQQLLKPGRGRHHPAGHLPGRRNSGAEEDRRHRRIALRAGGAAQPAGPAGHAGEHPLRRVHAELRHPGIPPGRRIAAQGPDQGRHHRGARTAIWRFPTSRAGATRWMRTPSSACRRSRGIAVSRSPPMARRVSFRP